MSKSLSMNHFDEHILELYVLGSEKVESQRHEVQEHLLVCHGCRALVEKMRAFYADADEELKSLENLQPEPTTTLARKRHEITLHHEWISQPMPMYPLTRFERFQRIVRRHPVVAGAGSFAAIAIAAALINFFALPKKDINPTAYLYNTSENKIEFYNREGDKLWSLGDMAAGEDKAHDTPSWKRTVVTDLDGDGVNEVITTSALLEDQSEVQLCLRVFRARGDLLFRRQFTEKFTYLNRFYSPRFSSYSILPFSLGKSSSEDIFVTTVNNGRSPSFLAHLDSYGNDIGKYWHFGRVDFAMDTVEMAAGHQKAIILCGEDDTADSTGGEFPFVAVLDPAKIVGDRKSTGSPGFGFPPSDAELYYVKLPTPQVDLLTRKRPLINRIQKEGNGILSIFCSSDEAHNPPAFYFYFTADMQVSEVKSDDPTSRLYRELREEGKISYTLTPDYLESLKQDVRYWNGKEWRKEVVGVHHE